MVLAGMTAMVGRHIWLEKHSTAGGASGADSAHIELGLPAAEQGGNEDNFVAASALLYEADSGRILFEQNGFERRPIASITKLMTAMVALDSGIDWDQEATILPNEYVQGGQLLLHRGETVRIRDLWAASLLGSANNATLAYVRELGIPEDEFIRRMNRKAIELGLEQTEFAEVTGLDSDNVSTAYEVARLAEVAFGEYPEIAEFASMPEYTMTALGSGREHVIRNTNKLMGEGINFVGSKTGFLYEAGYCLVIQGEDKFAGRIAVILGSDYENSYFSEAWRLLQHK